MTAPTIGEIRTLIPVFSEHACCGHILRTAKGFKAYDVSDRLVGVFETADLGVAAILATEVTE
jgi:hypothetical protein